MGLEQASKERSTSSWPARWPWILLQIYPHHQSALRMIPCALEFRNRSRRPAWICKQMHPQLMTLFYNCALKIASRKVFSEYNPLIDKLSPHTILRFVYIRSGLTKERKDDTRNVFLTKLCLNIGIDRYSHEINLIQNEMER